MMPKNRSSSVQPLLRKSPSDLNAKLLNRKSQARAAIASTKNKKKSARADVVHLHHIDTAPSATSSSSCITL
jgi:hypothetical protein